MRAGLTGWWNPHEEENGADNSLTEKAGESESEACQAQAATIPTKPSQKEVDAHMLTHLPYRAWCPHCVRGKDKGKPHPRAKNGDKTIPTVALDYMFMHEAQASKEERGMPILVTKDVLQEGSGTGMKSARVVPKKGLYISMQ